MRGHLGAQDMFLTCSISPPSSHHRPRPNFQVLAHNSAFGGEDLISVSALLGTAASARRRKQSMGAAQNKSRRESIDPSLLRPSGLYAASQCAHRSALLALPRTPPPRTINSRSSGVLVRRRRTLRRARARAHVCLPGDERVLRKMVLERKIAPFFRGEEEGEEECPICMLYYSGGLNRANCCQQGLCSECYLQIVPRANKTARCRTTLSAPSPPPSQPLAWALVPTRVCVHVITCTPMRACPLHLCACPRVPVHAHPCIGPPYCDVYVCAGRQLPLL